MEFRTEIKQLQSSFSIDHHSDILMLGSCFSENIGSRLQMYKFHCKINPFGTIFNPVSIAKLINWSLTDHRIIASELTQNLDLYFHYNMHSDLSSTDSEGLMMSINQTLDQTAADLKSCDALFVTLGSAIAYKHNDTGDIVANCHKMPATIFTKQLLTIESSYQALYEAFAQIIAVNPRINIVLTVSPVRHTRNGIVADHRSKARLVEISHAITDNLSNVSYFPSYELMMDDLRDYRYYEKDLIHPNEIAVDYIWEKFANLYLLPETQSLNQRIQKLLNALNHRPKNTSSTHYQTFVSKTKEEISALNVLLPKECCF